MPIILERRYAARFLSAARAVAVALPLLVASCGGNAPGTILAVPNRVAIADLNGDGLPDVVVVSAQIDQTGRTQNNPGFAAVILQNPSSKGNFEPTLHYETNGSPSGLAVGDLEGSGMNDLESRHVPGTDHQLGAPQSCDPRRGGRSQRGRQARYRGHELRHER